MRVKRAFRPDSQKQDHVVDRLPLLLGALQPVAAYALVGAFIGGLFGYIVGTTNTGIHFHHPVSLLPKILTYAWIARWYILLGVIGGLVLGGVWCVILNSYWRTYR